MPGVPSHRLPNFDLELTMFQIDRIVEDAKNELLVRMNRKPRAVAILLPGLVRQSCDLETARQHLEDFRQAIESREQRMWSRSETSYLVVSVGHRLKVPQSRLRESIANGFHGEPHRSMKYPGLTAYLSTRWTANTLILARNGLSPTEVP